MKNSDEMQKRAEEKRQSKFDVNDVTRDCSYIIFEFSAPISNPIQRRYFIMEHQKNIQVI